MPQGRFSSVRDEPYTVVSVAGDTQTTLEDVKFLSVGVTLIVAPFINKDDLVTMDVQLEISSLVEFRNIVPAVDRSMAQSNVSVKDNGTQILGGLRQRQCAKVVRGLPYLSKVPVIGVLFRNKRNDNAEREIILILRPHLSAASTPSPPKMGRRVMGHHPRPFRNVWFLLSTYGLGDRIVPAKPIPRRRNHNVRYVDDSHLFR